MKKLLPFILVVVAVAAAAFIFLKKKEVHRARAAELVPAETILFAQLPDLARTLARWPETGLAKIIAEPEMQAFLAKPTEKAGELPGWKDKLEQIERIAPREAFVAVTSIDGPVPRFVAGFAFTGRKGDVEALLAEPRAELKRMWPAGKSDLAHYAGTEIETFTHGEMMVAEVIAGTWYFVSNDMELLHATMDASGRPSGGNSLAGSKIFKKATAPLPGEGDALVFAQLGTLTERIVSLLVASGQAPDPKQVADLKRMQAVAWGSKLEGAQIRDTIFLLAPGGAIEAPLPRSALAFGTPDTFLYYAMAMPEKIELPAQSLALGAFLPGFAGLEKALEEKGLKWSDLSLAFGPELGSLVNWPADADQPSALLALDVRDAAKAMSFVEVFTGGAMGSPAWGRAEQDGVTLFQSPPAEGLPVASPAMALTDKFLLLGFSPEALQAGLQRRAAGGAAVSQNPTYQAAAKEVAAPTSGFGYLDLKTLFERSYGTLRPFIAMSLALSPDAAQYVDAGKLPSAETISKHLTPSVYSQSTTPEGTLVESVGTLTFNQVLVASIGGAAAAVFPMIDAALAGGLNFDPSLLQMTAPSAAPEPNLPDAADGPLLPGPPATPDAATPVP